MPSYTYICFECRKVARRTTQMVVAGVKCPSCKKEMVSAGSKARVPPKDLEKDWEEFRAWCKATDFGYQNPNNNRPHFLPVKGHEARVAWLNSEIEKYFAMPKDTERDLKLRTLRKEVAALMTSQI